MNMIKASMDYEDALLAENRAKAKSILHMVSISSPNADYLERIIGLTLESIGSKWEEGDVSPEQVFRSAIIGEENILEYLPNEHHINKSKKVGLVLFHDHPTPEMKIISAILKSYGYSVVDYGYGLNTGEIADMAVRDGVRALLIALNVDAQALKLKDIKERFEARGSGIKAVALCPDGRIWNNVFADSVVKNVSQMVKSLRLLLEEPA